MIDIVCNIDENYVEYCGVMLTSLFIHNTQERFRIHAINSNVTSSRKKRLSGFCNRFNAEICFYDVPFSSIEDFPIKPQDHLSLAAYLRIFMSELLPDTVDKVLYLDCDLMVIDSIKELWETNIEHFSLAAVEERPPYDTDSPVNLGYPVEYSYFNSGVMLINLKRWRETNLSECCRDFIKSNYSKLKLHDQDVLNALLYRQRMFLPIRWNIMDFFLFTRPLIQPRRLPDLHEAIDHPVIIHFTGKRKPWLHNCDSPYRNRYIALARAYQWNVISRKESVRYCIRKAWYALMTSTRLQKRRTISVKKR